VSIPASRSPEGLPLGLQLVGRPWSEAELLATAAWCEQVLAWETQEPPA
jgi:amidase